MNAGRAVRIVGRFGVSLALGLVLAAGGGHAFGQTVVVGEEQPQTEINTAVLDQLGPPPTLPDLLLGQQGRSPPGAAVKLHHPRAHAPAKASGAAKTAESKKPPHVKAAQSGKPSKPIQVANAEPPAPPKVAPTVAAKPLVSAQKMPAVNADMPPAAAAQTPPPTPPANASASAQAAAPSPAAVETPPPAPPAAAAPPAGEPATQTAEATPTPPPAKPLVSAAEAGGSLPASKPQQQALLTPPPAAAPAGTAATIPFAKDAADLSDDAKAALTDLAKRAVADESIQIQVMAYASGDEEHASKARRLSLSRALAVRSFLIDQGVHSTRIEVRALGNKVTEGLADRVDLVEEKR